MNNIISKCLLLFSSCVCVSGRVCVVPGAVVLPLGLIFVRGGGSYCVWIVDGLLRGLCDVMF